MECSSSVEKVVELIYPNPMNCLRFLLILACCLPMYLNAQQKVDINQIVTFKYRNMRLGSILTNISKSYNLQFSYSPDIIPVNRKMSVRLRKKSLEVALNELFDDTKIVYTVIGDQIVLRTDQRKQTRSERLGELEAKRRKKRMPPPDPEPEIVDKEVPRYGWETPTLEDDDKPYIETPVDRRLRRKSTGKYTFGQISIVPVLSTNHPEAEETTNQLSLNLLWGRNGGLNGFELGGLMNMITGNVYGMQVGGLANHVQGNVYGTQLAGIFNRNDGYTGGFQFAGIYNQTGARSTAVQIAGIMNIVGGDITGAQWSGIGNLVYGDATALQIGNLFNLNKGDAKMQISSLFNMAEEVETGQACLLFNKASFVRGFQMGLVNISDSIVGAPIGLLSLVKHGYNRVELFSSEVFHAGIGLKLGAKPFYNILQVGAHWEDPPMASARQGQMSWGLGYGFGTAKPLGKAKKHLWNLEWTASHINEGEGWTKKLNLLGQMRVSFDFYLGKRFSLFFGPTANVMFTKLQSGDPETPVTGSRIPQWTFFDDTKQPASGSTKKAVNRTAWVGFQAGMRF